MYPRIKELIEAKDKLVAEKATPPFIIKADLKTFDFKSLGTKFDVILIDPPWHEYCRRAPGMIDTFWTPDDIAELPIESISESPSFLFLWIGSAEGLEEGRKLLKKWGFRRCEDICWVKSNKNQQICTLSDDDAIFEHTKEHCLMGIKGTVRRSKDGHIINANIDTDVIVSEEPYPLGDTRKPEELYSIIEHFSLGRRRLELFGRINNIRPGWVTIGIELPFTNYNPEKYLKYFEGENGHLIGTTENIENMRPKSPVQKTFKEKKTKSSNVRS